ncbi:MAG: hypothetical protein HYT94_01490, partial [Parcubacteria group bacterium]|nr:hypothetical protein [Parcubacteria group bacterium]
MEAKIPLFSLALFFVSSTAAFASAPLGDILYQNLGMSSYADGEITPPHCIPAGTTSLYSCQFNQGIFYTPTVSDPIGSVQLVYTQNNATTSNYLLICTTPNCIGTTVATSTVRVVPKENYHAAYGRNITFDFSDSPQLQAGTRYSFRILPTTLNYFTPYDNNKTAKPLLVIRSRAATTSPLTLSNPTETEDDNNQDGKGVADKTVFTFSVEATGAPGTVTLIAVSEAGTTTLPLPRTTLGNYSATSTFPKGHYMWHIEASDGTNNVRTIEQTFTTGYSNIAFLPGLEASRLYRPATDPTDPSVTKVRLWEPPLALQDNAQLFLNPNGTPVRDDIFTGDVIDEAIGFNIYEKFIDSMDELVESNIISAWKPLPYDWRFDIHDIVENPIALETASYSMIEEIQKLAETSDTGKVTIIAHSNGGLVGKTLISELEGRGGANSLDKFIMVAVPQLGTPKAIAALLHGEGMPSDMLPILLSKSDARTLGENMPSGYSLLPSVEYLARVIDPVASFDSTDALTAPYFAQYGSVITNQTELHGFLLGAEGRAKPETSDTFTPNILNETLLLQAESNHAILDNWQAPENVEVIQIAGWGVPTISGLKYTSADACGGGGCIILDHEPVLTSDGDSTVVTPSAIAMNTSLIKTFYVNIKKQKKEHKNILESPALLEFVKNTIQNFTDIFPVDFTTAKPVATPDDSPALRLKIHSPVSLHIYNSLGEHTGIATTTGSIKIVEKQIPNSYYFEMGEG